MYNTSTLKHKPVIELKNLNFSYRRQPDLFDSLDLQLTPGLNYGLLGCNGAGKTSLLHLLSGLLFPKSGQIAVMGFEPRRRQQPFLADLFFLSEDHHIPKVRIGRLLRMYAPFYPKFDRDYFEELLHHFGLEIDQHLNKLSFGEQKKAMIAFGLATRCRLLLLDEPTNGLDIPSKKQFREQLAGGIGPDQICILSTHQVRELEGMIDSVIIIDQGKIVLEETKEAIEEKLALQFCFQEPIVGEVLYYEQVPGGYHCLQLKSEDAASKKIDFELLFNAVIERPEEMRALF